MLGASPRLLRCTLTAEGMCSPGVKQGERIRGCSLMRHAMLLNSMGTGEFSLIPEHSWHTVVLQRKYEALLGDHASPCPSRHAVPNAGGAAGVPCRIDVKLAFSTMPVVPARATRLFLLCPHHPTPPTIAFLGHQPASISAPTAPHAILYPFPRSSSSAPPPSPQCRPAYPSISQPHLTMAGT